MNPDVPQSREIQTAAKAFPLEKAAANSLGLTPPDIRLVNVEGFTRPERPDRYLYGFTKKEGRDGTPDEEGFFKLANKPELQLKLARESDALKIAAKTGIPAVGIRHPYQETPEGGILHIEALDGEKGTILTSPELIAGSNPKYGARAALAFLKAGGREIPADVDSSKLNRGDWRNESHETFEKVWEEQNAVVFSPENATLVHSLVGSEKLQGIVSQVRSEIDPEIATRTNPNAEYFIHGDAAPNNLYLSDKKDEAVFVDFEDAAASHNLTLAQLTDLGNYYGRMWPNPEMQKQFLTSYMEHSPADSVEYNYKLLRTTAVFGAMFLAKYAMSPDNGEHPMAVSLLKNLEGNLSALELQYQKQKGVGVVETPQQEPPIPLPQV